MKQVSNYNLRVLVLIFTLLSMSCFTQKKVTNTPPPDVVREVDVIKDPTIQNPAEESDTSNSVPPIEVVEKEDLIEKEEPAPSVFDIVFLLPFNVEKNNLNYDNDSIASKSQMALDFYEGSLIGLEKLKNEGFSFNVSVYDTKSSDATVKQILKTTSIMDADLIIGPVYNKPLKVVSEFCKKHKIPVVSPLSPKTSFVSENPYYLNISPSIDTHCDYLMDYFDEINIDQLNMLHQNRPQDFKVADYFANKYPSQMDSTIEFTGMRINRLIYTDQSSEYLASYLSLDQPNYFLVVSYKERFVHDMLSRLYSLTDRYDITVFGMPNWYKFDNIEPEYYEGLNMHFPNNYFYNEDGFKVKDFERNYYLRLNKKPTEYACKGYDITIGLGHLISQHYGNKFSSGLNSFEELGTFTGYKFEPIYSDTSDKISFYENQFLQLLHYKDYKIQKVK